jgi:hypothetical protein
MLVAYRLAGLSALETYYVRVRVGAQFGAAYMAARATFDRRRGPFERKRAAFSWRRPPVGWPAPGLAG